MNTLMQSRNKLLEARFRNKLVDLSKPKFRGKLYDDPFLVIHNFFYICSPFYRHYRHFSIAKIFDDLINLKVGP